MLNAQADFSSNIKQANGLETLYDQLTKALGPSASFDDLLRSQLVYAVSAFDKLLHDLIRIGMVQIFASAGRAPTAKYLNDSIPMNVVSQLLAPVAIQPIEITFENLIREKHSVLSFQDPKKVADGLSYIWAEEHKWNKIAVKMGLTEDQARKQLSLIVTRRNAMVHEADMDPVTRQKQPISQVMSRFSSDFLQKLGDVICSLVI